MEGQQQLICWQNAYLHNCHTYICNYHTHTHTCRGFLICVWGEQMCWYLNNLWPADTVAISPHKWPQTPPPPCSPALSLPDFFYPFPKVNPGKWPNNDPLPRNAFYSSKKTKNNSRGLKIYARLFCARSSKRGQELTHIVALQWFRWLLVQLSEPVQQGGQFAASNIGSLAVQHTRLALESHIQCLLHGGRKHYFWLSRWDLEISLILYFCISRTIWYYLISVIFLFFSHNLIVINWSYLVFSFSISRIIIKFPKIEAELRVVASAFCKLNWTLCLDSSLSVSLSLSLAQLVA